MKNFKSDIPGYLHPVIIGSGHFRHLHSFLEQSGLNGSLFFIVDANVRKFHSQKFNTLMQKSRGKIPELVLTPGEKSKSFETLKKIINFLKANKADKNSVLVSIGGGVTGDAAGFASSIFMRGINLVHIPTTLVACTDSSIGGKTALNFGEIKNLIGSFYHPGFVLIDQDLLHTLPLKEILNGAGEVLKYALLSDEEFFRFVKNNFSALISLSPEILDLTIRHCVRFKASVVLKDEKESELRKILNLGHTFAHGFEAASGFRINHGSAVTAGLVCAINLSFQKNLIDMKQRDNLLTLFDQVSADRKVLKLNSDKIFSLMMFDKKRKNKNPEFILPLKPGEVIVGAEADRRKVKASIDKMKLYFSQTP